MLSLQEHVQSQREKLRNFFTKRELRSKLPRNPVTRASLIPRYHALHFKERYLTVPENLIQPNSIVAIIRAQRSK